MKRFHVHLHVEDLQQASPSTRSCSPPSRRARSDYAKWMLEDPRINFAISTRGDQAGIDHLGIQTDDRGRVELKARAEAADMALLDEGQATCCYARSEKHWITDPQGIAWEHFHTLEQHSGFRAKHLRSRALGRPAVHGAARVAGTCRASDRGIACCAPAPRGKPSRHPGEMSTAAAEKRGAIDRSAPD